jgi:hypothetical protein
VETEKSIRLSQMRIGERERLKAEQELAAKKVRRSRRCAPRLPLCVLCAPRFVPSGSFF